MSISTLALCLYWVLSIITPITLHPLKFHLHTKFWKYSSIVFCLIKYFSFFMNWLKIKKMVTITLYAKQKKRHRCIEQTFGLCGRRWGWDVSREQHRNMYIFYGERDHQPRWDAWDKCSGLVHWEDPEGSGREGGGRGDRDGEYM